MINKISKLNKAAAKALGWKDNEDSLHFHDSYDCAMLLVNEAIKDMNAADFETFTDKFEYHFILATPLEMSTAALESLKEENHDQ